MPLLLLPSSPRSLLLGLGTSPHMDSPGFLSDSAVCCSGVHSSRLRYEALPEVVDAMYRDERMDYVTHENCADDTMEQSELRRFQATCLSPFQPILIKNGNRDMSFVRRGHWNDGELGTATPPPPPVTTPYRLNCAAL